MIQAGIRLGGNEVTQGRDADWIRAHEELVALAAKRTELDWKEGTALLQAFRAGVHTHFGCASFAQYVELLLGYKPRTTEEKLRTATALENLPEMRRAVQDGELSWSAARELTRVATAETEAEWLAAAHGKILRQIEEMVSGRMAGDRPVDPPKAAARKHILRFEVSADTFATFREAVAALRRRSTSRFDDDALLLQMAREILHGPSDEGRSSYQIAVTTCPECRSGFQQAAGSLVELAPEAIEMARCDAQHLGDVETAELGDVETAHVDGASDVHVNAPKKKASQDIPPAVRRRVLRRDHGCCVVPGCRHGTFVDLHHLQPKSQGGTHDEDNLVTLCGGHHRALHEGKLTITGNPRSALSFRAGGQMPLFELPSARAVENRQRLLLALRTQGFRPQEAKLGAELAVDRVGPDADLPDLLRAAFVSLSEVSEIRARPARSWP